MQDFIENLFYNITNVSTKEWLAYPQYSKDTDTDLLFELSEDIYYINNIESAASAMEMSVLGAKNIVNMIKSKRYNIIRDEL